MLPGMGDRHDAYRPARSIDAVDNAKAPDSKAPEPLQISREGRANRRVHADRTQGGPDRPLDVGRQVAQRVPTRERVVAGLRGRPKTSSSDRPFPFFA